jgi:hypothetical protein
VVEEVGALAVGAAPHAAPQALDRIKGGRGHEQVDMRMEVQTPRMRVQHRHRAGAALELAVVVAEGVQRGPGALHQHGVDHALMLPGHAAQFSGQGKGDQEIVARHQSP